MPLKSQGCGEGDKGITGACWLAGLAEGRVRSHVSKEYGEKGRGGHPPVASMCAGTHIHHTYVHAHVCIAHTFKNLQKIRVIK